MARTQRVKMTVKVDGVTESVRAFNQYGKEASAELRDAATKSVDRIAPLMARAMEADGGPSALVATSIRAKRDRFPVIAAGGSSKVTGSRRKRKQRPATGDLFFGAEFGGRGTPRTQQFRQHKGTTGYAFYPTLRAHTIDLIDGYRDALERLAKKWARGGRSS